MDLFADFVATNVWVRRTYGLAFIIYLLIRIFQCCTSIWMVFSGIAAIIFVAKI
jgi:hypothetical protein